MTLDLQKEHGIPIKEVPLRLPKRNGKKLHYSTIHRWTKKGARGRVLESTMVGGIRYTSIEALQRFLREDVPSESSDIDIDAVLRQAGV